MNHNPLMLARWFTFFVWAAVAATALFWGLRLVVKPTPAPAQLQVADGTAALRGDLTRLLGAEAPMAAADAPPEPTADARFNLVGVVSPRSPQAAREGLALIAVDGKPPRAYRVGAVVDGQTVLQSVQPRGAALGPRDGPTLVALKIAPPVPATMGTLPPPVSMPQGVPTFRPPMPQGLPPQVQPPPGVMPQQGMPLPTPQSMREANQIK